MARIEALTEEQAAYLPVFRDEWLRVGLCTEPCDLARFRAAFDEMCDIAHQPHRWIWYCQSPLMAQVVMHLWPRLAGNNLEDNLEANLWDNLWANLGANLWANLGANLRDNLWDNLGANLWDNLWANLGDNLGDNLRANLGDNLRANLGANLRANLGDMQYRSTYWWGQMDAYWIAFYTFFETIGIQYAPADARKLALHREVAQSVCWWWPFDQVVFVSDRPRVIGKDSQGRLHSEDGPALAFCDGYALWFFHGVEVPSRVILTPSALTPAEIDAEQNAEVRRVMIERFGQDRYLRQGGAKKLQSDDFGTLWRKDMPDDEPIVMVECLNSTPEADGSFKTYFLRVPPTMKTARQALAWTFEKPRAAEYAPAIET